MLGYSPATFIPIIDLTNAVFKDLTISSYHKEMLVLLVGAYEGAAYEWEQHVSIAQAAGVRPDQFIAIAEDHLNDGGRSPTTGGSFCALARPSPSSERHRAYFLSTRGAILACRNSGTP
jgi:hypothetical protein